MEGRSRAPDKGRGRRLSRQPRLATSARQYCPPGL